MTRRSGAAASAPGVAPASAPPRERPGFALMAALWMIVIVGLTGYELAERARTQRLAVLNVLEQGAADAAADAALETVRAALERQLARPLATREVARDALAADPWGGLAFVPHDTLALDGARAVAAVYDPGARVNVNRATEDDLRRLFVALPLDASLADRLAQRILDWRDGDDLRRARGAERDDYLRSGARVLPANTDFGAVEELRLVDGMTPELSARLAPLLTTLGRGQINVNAAPRAVLLSLPGIGDEAAAVIVRAQGSTRPLRSLDELTLRLSAGAREAVRDAGAELSRRITFETRDVVVNAVGWTDGSPIRSRGEALYTRGGDALFTLWRRTGL